jgi:hypothetical protein
MAQDNTNPGAGGKAFDYAPEISRSAVEQIMRSNAAKSAYQVGIDEVWIWIHACLISKRGQRRRVLEAFLDAPNHRMTCQELVHFAPMYTPRISELRDAGFEIPNFPTPDAGTYYELLITEAQAREIRAALAVADVLKPVRGKKPVKSVTAAQSVAPPTNAVGQFGFGFELSASSFLDAERGVTK